MTVTNPAADVLGSGREPWRPTRRQRRTALVLLAGLLLVGTAGVLVRHQLGERAKDRAAVAALDLVVDTLPVDMQDLSQPFQLELHNQARTAVHVRWVRLEAPGYATRTEQTRLDALGLLPLPLDEDVPCTPALGDHPPVRMTIGLRTLRGTALTRSVGLTQDARAFVATRLRFRCGYLTPEEAFGLEVTGVRAAGDDVVVTARASNRSVLPLDLQRLSGLAGLRVTLSRALPLTLPPQATPVGNATHVPLTLRLHLVSCRLFMQAIRDAEATYPAQILVGRLAREGATTDLPVSVWPGEGLDAGTPQPDPETLLMQTCNRGAPPQGH